MAVCLHAGEVTIKLKDGVMYNPDIEGSESTHLPDKQVTYESG